MSHCEGKLHRENTRLLTKAVCVKLAPWHANVELKCLQDSMEQNAYSNFVLFRRLSLANTQIASIYLRKHFHDWAG